MRNSLVAAVIFVSLFAGPADFRTSAQSRPRVSHAGDLRPSGVIRPQAVSNALPLPCQTSTAITSGTPANGNLSGTDCTVTAGKYIDLYSFSGTSGQVVSISQTSTAFDAYLYLYDSSGNVIMENDDSGTGQDARIPPDLGVIVLPTTGTYYIGASSLSAGSTGGYTVTLSGDTSCAATSVTPSATISATIATTDCKVSGGGLVYYTKLYSFSGTSGQKIAVTMSSSAFDSYLILHTPSGAGTVEDDDGGGDPTARIPVTSGFLTLAETGTYIIEATAFDPLRTGAFTLTVTKSGNKPIADFDGDGKTDYSIFRPSGTAGAEWWYLKSGTPGGYGSFGFGASTDIPTPADFTGDGKTDLAFYRPGNGYWYVLKSEDFTYYAFPFGASTDIPTPGDFDGDGKADAAVYRPSTGAWYIYRSSDGQVAFGSLGNQNDKPAVSDYDGDGKADIGIFRAAGTAGAEWWYLKSGTPGAYGAIGFGISTDKPALADFTGDGKADIAVYRPGNGYWYVLKSEDFTYYAFPFGASTDIPTPGDFDGDGKADAAVYRPSTGTWYVFRSTNSAVDAASIGISTDRPLPGILVR